MTLYEMIMGGDEPGFFTKEDWSKLGKGLITDEGTIEAMLAEGYETAI